MNPVLKRIHEKEISHLKSLLSECQTVLEFYGDQKHWTILQSKNKVWMTVYDGKDLEGIGNNLEAGTKAREMLTKIKEVGDERST